MRAVHVIVVAGVALFIGVAASVVLVPDSRGAWGAGLAVLMVAIAAVDARRFIIPDELTAAALAHGLVYAAVEDSEIWAQALAWSGFLGVVPALAFLGVRAGDCRLACSWRPRSGSPVFLTPLCSSIRQPSRSKGKRRREIMSKIARFVSA